MKNITDQQAFLSNKTKWIWHPSFVFLRENQYLFHWAQQQKV